MVERLERKRSSGGDYTCWYWIPKICALDKNLYFEIPKKESQVVSHHGVQAGGISTIHPFQNNCRGTTKSLCSIQWKHELILLFLNCCRHYFF
jgi:hypothetical protein